MAVPRAILPESGFEVTHLEKGGLTWTSRNRGVPSILVGFATTIPTEKVKLKQMLIFHVTNKGHKIFNNVEPGEEDPVKHTRVARCRVVEWDDIILSKIGEIPESKDEERYITEWLAQHYLSNKDSAATQLSKQHHDKDLRKGLGTSNRPTQPFSWKSKSKNKPKKARKIITGTVKVRKPVKASTKVTGKVTGKAPGTGAGALHVVEDYDDDDISSLFGGANGNPTPDF